MADLPATLWSLPSYLASWVGRYGRDAIMARLTEAGLGLSHFGVLVTLRDCGPLAQYELAEHLEYARPHLVGHIDRLEAAGLVERRRDDRDRRRQTISLTDEGRALAEDLAGFASRAEVEVLSPLDAAERRRLGELLRKVVDGRGDRAAGTSPSE